MGTRVTRAAPHFPVEEVKERMKREARFWVRQHWWIIYNALIAPKPRRRDCQAHRRLGPDRPARHFRL